MPTTSSVNEPLRIFAIPGNGTEDVLVADDGRVYTGTVEGVIHELDPATGEVRPVGRTRGRPLGLEWLPDGRLLVCDASAGLQAVDLKSGDVEVLVDRIGGRQMKFCNNAAVASDGTIFFTDSSRQFPWRTGRPRSSRTPTAAAWSSGLPTGPSRSWSKDSASPTAWRSPATSPTSPWPSSMRARSTVAG